MYFNLNGKCHDSGYAREATGAEAKGRGPSDYLDNWVGDPLLTTG